MGLEVYLVEMFNGLDPIYIMLAIAALPFGECRASIVYGAMVGINPFLVFFGSVAANALVVPVIFFFLDQAHFMNLAKKILGRRIAKKIEKSKERFEVYEELALFGFVAVPMVGTGAWTGALIASILGLEKKKSFLVIAVGVITSATIVYFVTYGISGVFAYLG